MRKIGTLNYPKLAWRFVHYLAEKKISAEVRKNEGEIFDIWIHDDDVVDLAKNEFQGFIQNPDSEKFADASKKIDDAISAIKAVNPVQTMRPLARDLDQMEDKVTWFLIAVSCVIYLMSLLPRLQAWQSYFYFSEYISPQFMEIMHGQVWRIFTPIFLHGNFLHLAFNMLWLYQLGRSIERIDGFGFYLIFILTTAFSSNLAQYLLTGPAFGGMSGVVYGMLGYIFIMSRRQIASRYDMDQGTMIFMMIWLFLGLFGVIGNVANGTHVIGIITGVAIGYLKSSSRRSR